jgi:hypothetical protein
MAQEEPWLAHERDASVRGRRVYVGIDGHPIVVELRFFDNGRVTFALSFDGNPDMSFVQEPKR